MHTHTLSLTHIHSLTPTHFLFQFRHTQRAEGNNCAGGDVCQTHTHTRAHTHTFTLTHTHSHTFSHSHTLSLSSTHTHTLSLSLFNIHTLSLSLGTPNGQKVTILLEELYDLKKTEYDAWFVNIMELKQVHRVYMYH